MMRFLPALLLGAKLAASLSTSLDAATSPLTFSLGDSKYYVPAASQNAPVAKYPINGTTDQQWTLTALSVTDATVDATVLQSTWNQYEQDDVWTESFTDAVQIHCSVKSDVFETLRTEYWRTSECTLAADALAHLEDSSTKLLLLSGNFKEVSSSAIKVVHVASKALRGPYLASSESGVLSLFRVYGLFVDDWQGFTVGTIESDSGVHNYVQIFDGPRNSPFIPYPSKLYYNKSDEKPLAGLRFAVKVSPAAQSNCSGTDFF
jgi:hypothetical protein